jgi:hypothetical protein
VCCKHRYVRPPLAPSVPPWYAVHRPPEYASGHTPPPPHPQSGPPPPQVCGAVQVPQLATVRGEPQLSRPVTVPQVLPSRAQNSASLSGVHVGELQGPSSIQTAPQGQPPLAWGAQVLWSAQWAQFPLAQVQLRPPADTWLPAR